MSQSRLSANQPLVAPPHRRTKFIAGFMIAIVVSVSVGAIIGFEAGLRVANSNTAGRPPGWRYILVSGNVSIGSLGIPRTITFDSPTYGEHLSSMITTSASRSNQYQVYLVWPESYNVTIYYQDSLNNWQHCAARSGIFVVGSTQSQNFEC